MKEMWNGLWVRMKNTIGIALWAFGKLIMFPANLVCLIGAIPCIAAMAIRGDVILTNNPKHLLNEIFNP